MCFDKNRAVRLRLRQPFDFVQQHGLSYAAKASEQHTFLGSLRAHSSQQDLGLFQNGISPHKFWRRRTSPGREWVLDWIHEPFISIYKTLYTILPIIMYKCRIGP